MHKYWGKKPSNDLKELIEKYSEKGDTVFDPFAGYGVFGCEAYILNRNVVLNDLNPVANFLNVQLLNKDIDLDLIGKKWDIIRAEMAPYIDQWYGGEVNGNPVQFITVLRNKDNVPLKGKFKLPGDSLAREIVLDQDCVSLFLDREAAYQIKDWYPDCPLIQNSRISAKEGMTVADLFTKRTLACHARLYALIEAHTEGAEQDLFKVAFTANLANCSRLVPPIKSRGEMAPGAWMTGFYIAETYLENNVLAYFENRLKKVIKGKQDYLKHFHCEGQLNLIPGEYNNRYTTLLNDAKSVDLESDSVDYVFTDPPYGDAVPYFEQSILWNSWLKLSPDYKNEIVISDSKERGKNQVRFEIEIEAAFAEIRRVLKPNKHFSLTYHSLSGLEWKAITNACIKNGFELVDFSWLVQKSFTPRQINRAKTIKGDVLVTLKKGKLASQPLCLSDLEVTELFVSHIRNWIGNESLDTNEIFLRIMKMVYEDKILIGNIDLLKILSDNFRFSDNQHWITDDKLELSTVG